MFILLLSITNASAKMTTEVENPLSLNVFSNLIFSDNFNESLVNTLKGRGFYEYEESYRGSYSFGIERMAVYFYNIQVKNGKYLAQDPSKPALSIKIFYDEDTKVILRLSLYSPNMQMNRSYQFMLGMMAFDSPYQEEDNSLDYIYRLSNYSILINITASDRVLSVIKDNFYTGRAIARARNITAPANLYILKDLMMKKVWVEAVELLRGECGYKVTSFQQHYGTIDKRPIGVITLEINKTNAARLFYDYIEITYFEDNNTIALISKELQTNEHQSPLTDCILSMGFKNYSNWKYHGKFDGVTYTCDIVGDWLRFYNYLVSPETETVNRK